MILSCKDKKSCLSNLFVQTDTRVFVEKVETIKFRGVCFRRYIIQSSLDSIDCYWGIVNDTVFLLRHDYVTFPNPQFIPLLPLNAKQGDRYNYLDVIQSENIVIPGNLIEVRILSVQKMNGDTLYYFVHNCIPPYDVRVGMNYITPTISRKFHLSKKSGIIKYSVELKGDTKTLKFLW